MSTDQTRTYRRAESIVFLKTDEPFGGLSNMAGGFPLCVNGLEIRTSEALYQACRFPHLPEVQKLIIEQKSPMTAKMKSKPHRKNSRPDWDRVRVKIMRWCLRVKLAQNWATFSKLLQETGDRPIVEESRKDAFWGAKPVDADTLVGMNVLGRLLMELRAAVESEGRESLLEVGSLDIPDFRLAGRPIETVIAEDPAVAPTRPPDQSPWPGEASSSRAYQTSLFDSPKGPGTEVRDSAAGQRARAGIADLKPYPAMKDSGVPWLGEVPGHWEVRRLGALLRERKETNDDLRVTDVLSVQRDRGVIPYAEKGNIGNKKSDDISRYKIVRPEDIVVNCMNVIIGSVGLSKYTGCLSPVYYVLTRREPEDDPRYLNAYFQTRPFQQSLVRIGNGILAHRMRIPMELLKCELFPRPPAKEQAAIVRFLDYADWRIRRYVRAKQKLIKLLEEQKQAIIHRAVTRGLDPNVRLKPSGVEWLGDVPEHWEVLTLRRVITRVVDGPHHSPTYLDSGIPFLSARNIKPDRWSLDDAKFISEDDYKQFSRRVVPKPGDVLYTKGGTTGVARAVDLSFPFQVWVHVAVLKLKRDKVLPDYLALVLNSPRCYEQAQLFTRGATNQDLGLGRMKAICFTLPPLPEQEALLSAVVERIEGIQATVDRARREINLLREYRTRLIADVVTGKLDVREAAAKLPNVEEVPESSDSLDELAEEEEAGLAGLDVELDEVEA